MVPIILCAALFQAVLAAALVESGLLSRQLRNPAPHTAPQRRMPPRTQPRNPNPVGPKPRNPNPVGPKPSGPARERLLRGLATTCGAPFTPVAPAKASPRSPMV
jgi:hypothetical protein